MGNAIQQVIESMRQGQDRGAVSVTIRIPTQPFGRLVLIADQLGISRTKLLGDLAVAGITDAWDELGLTEARGREAQDRPARASSDGHAVSLTDTWIFQATPKKYLLRQALARIDEHEGKLLWLTTRYRDRIRPGHRAYIWEAGPVGGILAISTVLTEPAIRSDDAWEMEFAIDQARFQVPDWRVEIHIDRVLPKPVSRNELEKHPVLKTLEILKIWRSTNFRVTPEQAEALAELIPAL